MFSRVGVSLAYPRSPTSLCNVYKIYQACDTSWVRPSLILLLTQGLCPTNFLKCYWIQILEYMYVQNDQGFSLLLLTTLIGRGPHSTSCQKTDNVANMHFGSCLKSESESPILFSRNWLFKPLVPTQTCLKGRFEGPEFVRLPDWLVTARVVVGEPD